MSITRISLLALLFAVPAQAQTKITTNNARIGVPVSVSPGGTNQAGTSTSFSAADHVHACPTATGTTSGCLSSSDWTRFNGTAFTSINQYLSPMTGAVSEPISSKLNDNVSACDAEGATCPNGVDDTSAIQAAVNYGCLTGRKVYLRGGTWKTSTTIAACSNIVIYGDGKNATVVRPTMTDGSPAFNFPVGANYFAMADIAVIANVVNGTTYQAGTSTAQSAIGIRVQSTTPSGPFAARFSFRNVRVEGFATCLDVTGFIVNFDNVSANFCDVGLKGSTMNAADLNLRMEGNRQDFSFISSTSVLLRQFFAEGSNVNATPSTVDNCTSFTMLSPYFEADPAHPKTVSWLSVGATTQVNQFRVIGGNFTGGANLATGVYPIKLDHVAGVNINANINDTTQGRKVSTTANTTDLELTGHIDGQWTEDAGSNQIGPSLNYWPNRQFDLWFRGWDAVVPSGRVAFTQETTIVRKGANAVRITANAGANFNYLAFRLSGNAVTALRGKNIRVGAWIWIPAITAYNEAARTAVPAIVLESFNGTVSVNNTGGASTSVSGTWNFFTTNITVQADSTRLNLYIYANDSATNATGAEFIVADSINLVEQSTPTYRQMRDELVDSPLIASIGVNGKMIARSSAAPTDTNQTYAQGDTVFNTAPVTGGPLGWTCTVGGSPGTWVAFGPIGHFTVPLAAGAGSTTVPTGCVPVCTDSTAAAAVKASVASTTLTLAGTGTDVINCGCLF